MPIQINTSIKGKEYAPYVVHVERGKIKEFARAIGDLSPFYLDDEVGRASPWGDIIAPPTFAITFRDERADTGVVPERSRHRHLAHPPRRAGVRALSSPSGPATPSSAAARITDIYEKSGKSGPMAFVVRETTVTDADNDVVAKVRGITVVRL